MSYFESCTIKYSSPASGKAVWCDRYCNTKDKGAFAQLMKQQEKEGLPGIKAINSCQAKARKTNTIKLLIKVLEKYFNQKICWQNNYDFHQTKESAQNTLHIKITNTRLQGCELVLSNHKVSGLVTTLNIHLIASNQEQIKWLTKLHSKLINQLLCLLPVTYITLSLSKVP